MSILFVGTAWADNCVPTTDMLKNGGDFRYDDYLYPDSQQFELRKEIKPGKAYLCGTGYCNVGTKIRLQNAMVGSSRTSQDAVYECINTSKSGRTSFQWEIHEVQPTCNVRSPQIATPVSESDVRNAKTLFIYNGDYCKRVATSANVTVNAKTNFWDTANTFLTQKGETVRTTINVVGSTVTNWFDDITEVTVKTIDGGIEITKQNTERIKIMTNGAVEMWDSSNQRRIANWRTTKDGIVEIYGQTKEGFLGGLQILSDGRVQIVNSRHEKRTEIAKTRNESYRATIKFFDDVMKGAYGVTCNFSETVRTYIKSAAEVAKVAIQETGATVRTGITESSAVIQNFFDNSTDFIIDFADNTKELIITNKKENTKRIRLLGKGFVEINGQLLDAGTARWQAVTDNTAKIVIKVADTVLGGFELLGKGGIAVFKGAKEIVTTTISETNASYRATLEFFGTNITEFGETVRTLIIKKAEIAGIAIQEVGATVRTGIQETGATVRTAMDDMTDVTITRINGGVELVSNVVNANTKRIEILTDGTVRMWDSSNQRRSANWKTTTDGIVQIYEQTKDGVLGGLQILSDGRVQIINSRNEVLKVIAKEHGESYRATIQFFGDVMNGVGNVACDFNETVRTSIVKAGEVVGIAIQTTGAVIMNWTDNATDFAKHFTSEIVGGIKAWQINSEKLSKLEADIARCTTQDQVAELIAKALREAELNDKQIAEVREMIDVYAKKQDQHFDIIENKIKSLEQEIYEIQQQNIELAKKISGLGVQYNNLAAEVRTKVNAKQVVELIRQNTQNFTEGQKEELNKILEEYTWKLSDGQRAEVQSMITGYVDPLVRNLNTKINLESDRRAAESRVASAMSVLNSFAASADVSVWKNAEGNFNGARLASDSIAGVVLGTAGGLISNSLIKKSQTKKGFEDIRCTVGGQFVADYDDDFAVGIK